MSTNFLDPARSEAYFRQCNSKADYLRSRPRLVAALGVLDVSEAKATEINDKVDDLWQSGGGPVNFGVRNHEGEKRRDDIIAAVSAQFPDVFRMDAKGVQAEKFVRERVIKAMIILSNRNMRNKKNWAKGSKQAAADEPDQDEETEHVATRERDNPQPEVQERAMFPNAVRVESATSTPEQEDFFSSPASSLEPTQLSGDEAETQSKKRKMPSPGPDDEDITPAAQKARQTGCGPLPALFVQIWSAEQGQPVTTKLELKNVVVEGGRAPDIDKLRKEVRSALPITSRLLSVPNQEILFVHVLYDGATAKFISQEVLQMEWTDWRKGNPTGKTFHLYVDDREGPEPHVRVRPAKKMSFGAPLIQPMFVRLPLTS